MNKKQEQRELMTREEILNMPAGREMDALVAEKGVGWESEEEIGIVESDDDPSDEDWFKPFPMIEKYLIKDTGEKFYIWYQPEGGKREWYDVEQDLPEFSADIAAALPVAEKMELALIPILVYDNRKQWNEPGGRHSKIWWAALPATSNPSVYLPIEQYDNEWNGWVETIDESITLNMVAETAPLAICRATLILKLIGLRNYG